MRCTALVLQLTCVLLLASNVNPLHGGEGNWPRYRGPDGSGHVEDTDLTKTWSADDIQWRTELDGAGQSSPCIWGDKIFVTTAKINEQGQVERSVVCLDRNTGKILWQQLAATGGGESIHNMNTWATPTCATDGERVVAYFGPGGIHCYDLDGNKKWSRELGDFPGDWGIAASPIILGEMVIQNCDAQGPCYLVALDKESGDIIWKTTRRDLPKGGWSTPIVIDTGERTELVLNGEFGVQAYDPTSGEELWFCKSFNGRGSPVPAWGHGLLYVVNGKPGDIYAVKPGGSGDVTATHMAWHTGRGGDRDLPSPILVGTHVFTVSMKGIATMYEAASGREIWKKRLGGNYSGPPISVGGLIYIQNQSGETVVIQPAKSLNIVARNSLDTSADEIFRSEPVPSRGQIYMRSNRAVYCVGKPIDSAEK